MTIRISRWGWIVLLLVAAFALGGLTVRALNTVAAPSALGTGFTYQGYLTDGGAPLTGICDLTFELWDADSGGGQVGGDVFLNNIAITDGRFTVTLNDADEFGPTAFTGNNRWLQIAVQCGTDPSPTVLTDRQPINPVPYAMFAERFAGYQNIIMVAQSGGDFTSLVAAVDAIGVDPAYPAASSSNRYLVYVAPGTYVGRVQMKEYVDIEGAGQGITVLQAGSGVELGPLGATVSGANNAEIRNLTIENVGGPDLWALAFYDAAQTRVTDVTLIADGGPGPTAGRPRALGVGSTGHPILNRVQLFATNGSSSTLGMDVYQGSLTAEDIYVYATGPTTTHGIFFNAAQSVTVRNATVYASGNTTETNGVHGGSGLGTVVLDGLDVTVEAPTGLARGLYLQTTDSLTLTNSTFEVTALEDAAPAIAMGAYFLSVDVVGQNNRFVVNAQSTAYGVYAVASSSQVFEIDEWDIRATSTNGVVIGLYLGGTGPIAASVSDVDVYAQGTNSGSLAHYGVYHNTAGSAEYDSVQVTLASASASGFAYGFKARLGALNVNDLTVDATHTSSGTIFGLEWDNAVADNSTLHNAVIHAEQLGTGDAVGTKINQTGSFELHNVHSTALADRDAWGFHLQQADITATGLTAYASSRQDSRVAYGLRCDSNATLAVNGFDLFATSIAPDPSLTYAIYAGACPVILQNGVGVAQADDSTNYGLSLVGSGGLLENVRLEASGDNVGIGAANLGLAVFTGTDQLTMSHVTASGMGGGGATNYGVYLNGPNTVGGTFQTVLMRHSTLIGSSFALRVQFGTTFVGVNSVLEGGATSLLPGVLIPTATCTDITYDTAALTYARLEGPATCP